MLIPLYIAIVTILLVELTSIECSETAKAILPFMISGPKVIFTTLLPSIASTAISNARIKLILNNYSIPRSDKKLSFVELRL